MKNVRFVSEVFDMKTREYARHIVTMPVSDELASMLKKEISNNLHRANVVDGLDKMYDSPLKNAKRYGLATHCVISDEDDNDLGGFMNM